MTIVNCEKPTRIRNSIYGPELNSEEENTDEPNQYQTPVF